MGCDVVGKVIVVAVRFQFYTCFPNDSFYIRQLSARRAGSVRAVGSQGVRVILVSSVVFGWAFCRLTRLSV